MKINYGYGALAVLLCFMAGMSYLVYRCSQQPIGLVSQEYYNQELKYTEQMNKVRNSKALNEKVDIAFSASSQEVVVKYPAMKPDRAISGEILFFKPDNNAYDFTIPVMMDSDRLQLINAGKLPHGAWWIKINWRSEGTTYYNEEKIFIN